MQRIFNNPGKVVDETLDGFVQAHGNTVRYGTTNKRVIVSNTCGNIDRVGVITGGGSGHEPAFIGYVGKNMVDAVAVGEIFSSPTALAFADAAKECHTGQGVACLYGNYSGDNMNVKMAIKILAKQGITMKTVIANDDVVSAPKGEEHKRRGVAGEILMWKVGGAKASTGAPLDEVIATAQKAIDNTRSMGIGLTPCVIPEVGHANFTIEPGKMEVGIGHHGEAGIEICHIESSKQLAHRMVRAIAPDLPFVRGDDVVVLVSGLGATPINELYIFYSDVAAILGDMGITIHKSMVGNYFTSLDMGGITLTLMKLDDELRELMDMPARCVGFGV